MILNTDGSAAIVSSETSPIATMRVEWVIVGCQTQHELKKAAGSLNTVIVSCVSGMKSIWKSSELFLLHSVEKHSKARRQGEKSLDSDWNSRLLHKDT